MHVLIVEDTAEVVDIIDVSLKIRWPDCEVTAVSRGSMAMGVLAVNKPDLVILDLGLPDMDGLELLADMRRVSTVPVIILTSRGHEAARVRGLETGADDYIVKLFKPIVFIARLKAVLRRAYPPAQRPDNAKPGKPSTATSLVPLKGKAVGGRQFGQTNKKGQQLC